MRFFLGVVLLSTACSLGPSPVINFFRCDGTLITRGNSITCRWESQGGTEARIDTNFGAPITNSAPTSGNIIVTPLVSTLYTLTVTRNDRNPVYANFLVEVK